MAKVFVYGTLKRGFPLFEKGLVGATFLGEHSTAVPYPLFIAMPFFGPVMLDRPGTGLRVRGELFEVEEERMPVLDRLEDVGEPGSFRSTVPVTPETGAGFVLATGFMKTELWLDPLHTSYLSDYQDTRFVPPWER